MTKTIWKYDLKIGSNKIYMPIGAEILTVQMQNDLPVMWALLNPESPKKNRVIQAFGTGWDIDCPVGTDRKYIGTIQLDEFGLVYHFFEII